MMMDCVLFYFYNNPLIIDFKELKMSEQYQNEYSEQGLWNKIKEYSKTIGESVLSPVLTLYACAEDSKNPIPTWVKTTIYSALGYFILPVDVIPDVIPAVGYTDDVGVLVAALAAVSLYIKPEHKEFAQEKLKQWFD
ncbi:hypothetical protein HMPREF9098_0183 [Kingella denitrificans ATCC 33394]|uniref:DUF1232 domain-containing protein n=2 Tax=Kingella denitrificans TaxID=502 RepID=F0EWE9_9NEIS|nr:hypothetical protein HMPREF9098_0183 [Kingella denitrificans ATCC 33394]